MLRGGKSRDMKTLVQHYIVASTAYVLQMRENVVIVTQFDSNFSREGMLLGKMLAQILADIRRIPGEREIIREKNYANFGGIVESDVVQLQSLSDLLSGYFTVESDYVPKLTYLQQSAFPVDDQAWKIDQDAKLLRGIDHHFKIYPDKRYTPPTQGSIGGIQLV